MRKTNSDNSTAKKTITKSPKKSAKTSASNEAKSAAGDAGVQMPTLNIDLDNLDLDDIDLSDIEFNEDDEESYLEIDKATAAPSADALDLSMELKLSENSAENNFVQMAKFKTLGKKEEFDLARRIEIGLYADHLLQTGAVAKKDIKDYKWLVDDGKRAKTIFTNANRKLISHSIKTLPPASIKNENINTLTIYGQMGLNIAISKYDYKSGNRFSTYAKVRIQATIKREISNHRDLIKKPQHITEKKYKMHNIALKFESAHGREPTNDELVELMGVSLDDIKLYKGADKTEKSIYDNIGDTDGSVYIDTVEDENLDGIFDMENKSYENNRLRVVLDKIATKDEKARDAFSLYYGFNEGRGRIENKSEIGKILNIGEQQVDNLIHRAEAKVCHPAFGLLSDFSEADVPSEL